MKREIWFIKYDNGMCDEAVLEQMTDGTWFVDMGCNLWNKTYKSKKWAVKYLVRCNYKRRAIRCDFMHSTVAFPNSCTETRWVCLIHDSGAMVDCKKSMWVGRTKEHAFDRASKTLNEHGYTAIMGTIMGKEVE